MQTKTYEMARTYVDHVAAIEDQQRWPTPFDRLSEASQKFGQLCLEAAQTESIPNIVEVRNQLGKVMSQSWESTSIRNRAELFSVSIGWLSNGGDIGKCQRALQFRTAKHLESHIERLEHRPKKFRGLILGDIGELAIMGAINFMDDPNYFAIPSLPHHNEHPKSQKSYDLTLITGKDLGIQPIQIKFGCQNFCNNPIAPPHKPNKQGHYSHEIALMSAHCDAGMHYDQNISKGNLIFADALSRSVLKPSSITNDEFELLFHVGDASIENLTGFELKDRLGMATTPSRDRGEELSQQGQHISPRARRKALKNSERNYSNDLPQTSKGYSNNSSRRARKLRGGTAQDYAYA